MIEVLLLAALFLLSLYGIGLAVYYKTAENNEWFTFFSSILALFPCTTFFWLLLEVLK